METEVVEALQLTMLVAGASTLAVIAPGTLVAYALARSKFRGRSLVSALVVLPMVLPPTAVGYLLLVALADDGPLGADTLGFDLGILFTWRAAVLASATMAFPLVVRTAQVTFEGIDPKLEAMARTLGHGPVSVFVRFTLPLASRGLLAAAILGFVRAVGEFGATIMIAGNIPGRTQTLASGIFAAQQVGNDREAHVLLAIAVAVGLVSVLAAERLVRATGAR